jgi:hypothetical protein
MLNHGFSGHSNHSCDMDVFNIEQARLAVNRKDGSIALAAADGRL